ncbi:hypothetical protein ACLOJK_008745 [Asimina triloba]
MAAVSGKSGVVVLMLVCAIIILVATHTAEAQAANCLSACNEECLRQPAYPAAANCKADCSKACNAVAEAVKVLGGILADEKLRTVLDESLLRP